MTIVKKILALLLASILLLLCSCDNGNIAESSESEAQSTEEQSEDMSESTSDQSEESSESTDESTEESEEISESTDESTEESEEISESTDESTEESEESTESTDESTEESEESSESTEETEDKDGTVEDVEKIAISGIFAGEWTSSEYPDIKLIIHKIHGNGMSADVTLSIGDNSKFFTLEYGKYEAEGYRFYHYYLLETEGELFFREDENKIVFSVENCSDKTYMGKEITFDKKAEAVYSLDTPLLGGWYCGNTNIIPPMVLTVSSQSKDGFGFIVEYESYFYTATQMKDGQLVFMSTNSDGDVRVSGNVSFSGNGMVITIDKGSPYHYTERGVYYFERASHMIPRDNLTEDVMFYTGYFQTRVVGPLSMTVQYEDGNFDKLCIFIYENRNIYNETKLYVGEINGSVVQLVDENGEEYGSMRLCLYCTYCDDKTPGRAVIFTRNMGTEETPDIVSYLLDVNGK